MIAPPAPAPPLSDEVIALRPYTEADVDELTDALQDLEIAAWTNVPAPYTRGQALRFVTEGPANYHRAGARDPRRRRRPPPGLERRAVRRSPALCGDRLRVAAAERGRGVAARAIRLVSRWAIEELGAGRVQILAAPDKVASRRAAERAGFTAEGTLRAYRVQKDRRVDLVMYSLLPGELALARGTGCSVP